MRKKRPQSVVGKRMPNYNKPHPTLTHCYNSPPQPIATPPHPNPTHCYPTPHARLQG